MGIRPAHIGLLGEVQIAACNAYSDLDLFALPTRLMEFHGTLPGVAQQAEAVWAIAAARPWGWLAVGDGSRRGEQALEDPPRCLIRRAGTAGRGLRGMPTDVCVPFSQLAEGNVETRRDLDASGVHAPINGDLGDGNFRAILTFDPADPGELAVCRALHGRLVRRALAMEGTCTGEHGIGCGK